MRARRLRHSQEPPRRCATGVSNPAAPADRGARPGRSPSSGAGFPAAGRPEVRLAWGRGGHGSKPLLRGAARELGPASTDCVLLLSLLSHQDSVLPLRGLCQSGPNRPFCF
ncbi:uncharacterized protein LOC110261070 isoform X2 [Sus scrofa]|uniref:uncharacterized protein LOC110261070 isoform X2 n=1 Tax=Sus scrofa TaxID=9823 RepID=UPI000A2B5443|nr:uncharacterized protein LOC110261070 isoform X2 [Sus scrofa]